jgi:hypothetical protein
LQASGAPIADGRASVHVPLIFACLAGDEISVAGVKWEGFKHEDGKTNYFPEYEGMKDKGGGDVIFAEHNAPLFDTWSEKQGKELHNKIRIQVTLNKPPPQKIKTTVHFRWFDPIRYDAAKLFISDADTPRTANDNIQTFPDGWSFLKESGNLQDKDFESYDVKSLTFFGDGTTKQIVHGFSVSACQPCNNFKVACHLAKDYLDKVVLGTNGNTLKEGKPGGANVPAAFQTPMLTVWRTLYVERNSMAKPDYTQGVAPSRFVSGKAVRHKEDKLRLTTELNIHKVGCENQFQDGKIELFDAKEKSLGKYDVFFNTVGKNSEVSLSDEPKKGTVAFKNLEDDDIAHGITAKDMEPDLSLLATRFAPACVLVNLTKSDLGEEVGKSVNRTDLPFQTNLGTDGTDKDFLQQLRKVVSENRSSVTHRGFWVAYIVGAFQPDVKRDVDPNSEDLVGGIAIQYSKVEGAPGTFIFLETLKDYTVNNVRGDVKISWDNQRKTVTVHEIGHMFVGGAHRKEDGPIMLADDIDSAGTQAQVNALQFGPAGLFRIISTMYPGNTYWDGKK